MAIAGELRCEGITPCVVRNNKAGQLVWSHLKSTGLFHLAYCLRGENEWQEFAVCTNSPDFLRICKELKQ